MQEQRYEKLKEITDRLHTLLSSPELGLVSWNLAVENLLDELCHAWGNISHSSPDLVHEINARTDFKIQQRWNRYGDTAWCVIKDGKIYPFEGENAAREAARHPNFDGLTFSSNDDFVLLAPPSIR